MFRAHRKLLLLAAVLAVAVIAVLAVRSAGKTEGGPEEDAASAGETGAAAPAEAYSALTYSNGSATLSFLLDESGKWVWADDPEFPLDDATVRAILALLTDLRPQQTLAGESLEDHGLDQPFASLTATEADGGTVSVALGDATTDGASYYALLNGQEDPVYILSGALYGYMSETIYDMCRLPELPALTEETIRSVSIEGAVSTLLRPIETGADEEAASVSWAKDSEDVTDLPATEALLSCLEALTIDRCVDYRPTEEAAALCGFDAPAAEVSVIYRTETGSEETLSLTIGGASLDGQGRYLRLNGEEAVYQVSADGAAAILSAAEGGLTAAGGAA